MRQVRRGAAGIRVQYRPAAGEQVDTTLDLVAAGELAQSLPVREFRWYKGQRHTRSFFRTMPTGVRVFYALTSYDIRPIGMIPRSA